MLFPSVPPGTAVIGKEEEAAVLDVLKHRSPFRHYGPGQVGRARQFEVELGRQVGTRHALAVSSGTAALKTSLVALSVGPGDEVILPAFTWIACPAAVALLGAVPVLAEIDESLTIDPADIERKITPRTKAVMVVHTGGIAADMDAILTVAHRHKLAVVEDCAQSAGARFRGKAVGSMGDVGAFSLQMNKTFTSGEGGAITTNDDTIFERAVTYHDLGFVRPQFGIERPRLNPGFGENYRMSELAAALALEQLRKLESKILAPMRGHKARLREALCDEPGIALRQLPDEAGDTGASFAFFAPTAESAAQLSEALAAENVPVVRPYGGKVLYQAWPDHFAGPADTGRHTTQLLTPQINPARYRQGACPRSEDVIGRTLMLGLSPVLMEQDVIDAITAIRKVVRAIVD
jgi:dTDP-4-amino-4,6-dideoxygalactose transaminase